MKRLLLLSLVGMLVGCGPTSTPTDPTVPSPTEPSVEPSITEPTSPTEPSISDPSSPDVSLPDPTIPEPELTKVSGQEALNSLKTPYSEAIETETYLGLSSLHEVGIDKDRFENEIDIYPVPETGNIFLAEDIGITKDAINNSGTFSLWLQNNKHLEGNKVIKFGDGVYPFTSKIDVTGIENLYIVGTGNTEFLYNGFGTYFEARSSKNVSIQGINFDKKYSPTISGTINNVQEIDGIAYVTLSIPNEFDLSQDCYSEPEGGSSYMECRYDEATGKYTPDNSKNLVYNSPTSANNKGIKSYSYNHSKRELTLGINMNFPYKAYKRQTIGTKVSYAYTMYESHGFFFKDCENTVLENINVYVTGGMALRFDCGKNAYINNVNYCQREGSERIMTATADIIHGCALEGELVITNCLLESSHDDALNIKSFYGKISSVSAAAKEIVVAQTQNEVTVSFEKGDTIEIYDPETYGIVDTFEVVECVKAGTTFTLTVNKRPRNVEVGYNVGNVTKATRMTLDNCLIRNKRNRGILLQARESIIKNCTFQNVIHGAVQILSVYDVFREAIMPESIDVINTKFLTCEGKDLNVFTYGSKGSGHTVPGSINNVNIKNNFFYNGKSDVITLDGTGNVEVANNLLHYDAKNTSTAVLVHASKDINIHDNLIISKFNIDFVLDVSNNTNIQVKNNQKREEV